AVRVAGAVLLAAGAAHPALAAQETVAYVGATLWDGTGSAAIPGATLVVRDGRVVSAGTEPAPAGARIENVAGRWIIPGLVDAHGHVSGQWAREGADEVARVRGDLSLYALYGVTSVVSLGGEPAAAFELRGARDATAPGHARMWLAGAVVTAAEPEAA